MRAHSFRSGTWRAAARLPASNQGRGIAAITALATCGQTTTVEPPVEPAAVETPAPLPPAPLTEADARTRAETAGYTGVTGLMQNPDGSWTGTGGATTSITINDSGVTAATAPAPATP